MLKQRAQYQRTVKSAAWPLTLALKIQHVSIGRMLREAGFEEGLGRKRRERDEISLRKLGEKTQDRQLTVGALG